LAGLANGIAALMEQWIARAPDVARENCLTTTRGTDSGCAGYHGVRPFLYCAGLRSSYSTYCEMFVPPLRQWVEAPPAPRILVSAAADFVVPAIVTQALKDLGRGPDLTIVDRCRTPLMMCEDAGIRLDMPWRLAQADVRAYQPSIPYDLIVSDRFLSFFHPSERCSIVDAWRRQLAKGGRVVTTVSIYPDTGPVTRDREVLHAETLRRYETQCGGQLPEVTREQLSRMVEIYSSFRHRHFISNAEEVVSLFEDCGFEVREVQSVTRKTDVSMLSTPARYIARIIADKSG
jgi:hypothetical protein